jgi:hypothetical protein
METLKQGRPKENGSTDPITEQPLISRNQAATVMGVSRSTVARAARVLREAHHPGISSAYVCTTNLWPYKKGDRVSPPRFDAATEAELDQAAALAPDDADRARAAARRHGSPMFVALLEAELEAG